MCEMEDVDGPGKEIMLGVRVGSTASIKNTKTKNGINGQPYAYPRSPVLNLAPQLAGTRRRR